MYAEYNKKSYYTEKHDNISEKKIFLEIYHDPIRTYIIQKRNAWKHKERIQEKSHQCTDICIRSSYGHKECKKIQKSTEYKKIFCYFYM